MPSILTLNQRHSYGLEVDRATFKMNAAQFRRWIREHYDSLVRGLAEYGIDYEQLGPALVPSTKRHEMALLFNVDALGDWWYSHAVTRRLLPLLDRKATRSVLHGDIGWHPSATRELALYSGLVRGTLSDWGEQLIYCVYLNNLSATQVTTLHTSFVDTPGYLGHVPATHHSAFRTEVADMLPAAFVQHRGAVITDHGLDEPLVGTSNEIGLPFDSFGFRTVSTVSALFAPLLSYKIQSQRAPLHRDDLLVSLNAISDDPMELNDFEVLIPEAKFGYLRSAKGELLKIAGLDEHSREDLAAVIRAEIENDYIYRLQTNIDGTVQFTIMLELPRSDGRQTKLVVGLKYFADRRQLSLVTLT
ncbi:hypothetical protein ACFC14_13675 [Microbacterium sp. NPDC055988]|uniref:hypothetical protein n=1 Tax=Microbacterium sp. NPDC055988 TaxID=3345671 RepID=UPI0035DB7E31